MICEYLNKATFVNLLMAVLFSECFSADFAFQIFKLHFSQKGIFTKFLDAPQDFFSLVLSIFYQIWLSYIGKAALKTYRGFFLFGEFSWCYTRLNSIQKYADTMAKKFGEHRNRSTVKSRVRIAV